MGQHFAGHGEAIGFGAPDQLRGAGRADMGDVQRAAGLADEFYIAGHHALLTGCRHPLDAEARGHGSGVHTATGRERLNL